MVARVDQVLKGEILASDGLADPGVFVLQIPGCGTGAYYVRSVCTRIATPPSEQGEGGTLAERLKQAANEPGGVRLRDSSSSFRGRALARIGLFPSAPTANRPSNERLTSGLPSKPDQRS